MLMTLESKTLKEIIKRIDKNQECQKIDFVFKYGFKTYICVCDKQFDILDVSVFDKFLNEVDFAKR